jgi:hypothetical protein
MIFDGQGVRDRREDVDRCHGMHIGATRVAREAVVLDQIVGDLYEAASDAAVVALDEVDHVGRRLDAARRHRGIRRGDIDDELIA